MPTWRGALVISVVLALAAFGFIRGIHGFLATDEPLNSDVLVVEGWVPEYALKVAVDRAARLKCRFLILTGGLVLGEVNPEPGDTYARVSANRLRSMGGLSDRVRVVESGGATRDRTYSSAVAVRDWLKGEGENVRSIDVLTLSVHARRSRLLFQEAMGPEVAVGIVSVPDREYEASHWWRYSEGVKEVLSEGAAYLYARFLFRPA